MKAHYRCEMTPPQCVNSAKHSELLVLQLMWRSLCFNTGIAVYRKLVLSFSACVGRCICPFKNNSHISCNAKISLCKVKWLVL